MSYIDNFSQATDASNYFTPQRQMNSIIRHCAEGASVHGNADLHAVEHLQRITQGMQSYLNGDVPGSELQSDIRLRQMTEIELGSIKEAIASACPITQTKALRDIISHGSLSSARLSGVKANRPAPQPEYTNTLDI